MYCFAFINSTKMCKNGYKKFYAVDFILRSKLQYK